MQPAPRALNSSPESPATLLAVVAVVALLLSGLPTSAVLGQTGADARAGDDRTLVEVPLNRGAGRGDPVLVTVRMEGGEDLTLIADTGVPVTLLDRSLEPKLGRRFMSLTTHYVYGGGSGGVYRAPRLYLRDFPLPLGGRVGTDDFQRLFPRPVMGILGMDCLRNLYLQLDCAERKLCVLATQEPAEHWGAPAALEE